MRVVKDCMTILKSVSSNRWEAATPCGFMWKRNTFALGAIPTYRHAD